MFCRGLRRKCFVANIAVFQTLWSLLSLMYLVARVNALCSIAPSPPQTAMKVKHEGENALQSAQLTKQLAEEQLVAAQAHEMSIREAQRLLASVRA